MDADHDKRMRYVDARLQTLGKMRIQQSLRVGSEGPPDLVSGSLLLALGMRESGLRPVLGDHTHARGDYQIHDLFHMETLRKYPGCPAFRGTISEYDKLTTDEQKTYRHVVSGAHAGLPYHCPRFIDANRIAVTLLDINCEQAIDHGVDDQHVINVAVAAYNTGMGAAMKGYHEGDIDKYTTGEDYSADVLLRRTNINEWLRNPSKY